MKVIVAGFPKTGTKSMNVALTKLGYKVYDSPENCYFLYEDYAKIYKEGWSTADFRRMYEDVDAVVDAPACNFWEEIHKAFPDAKIILTMRKNEEVWSRSWANQVEKNSANATWKLFSFLAPATIRHMKELAHLTGSIFLGRSRKSGKVHVNEAMSKLKYRAHNAHVLQNAPKDKLLIYSCSQGWGPLCSFLGVPIPDEPFPHKNVRGKVFEEMMRNHPIFKKVKQELLRKAVLIFFASSAGGYLLYKERRRCKLNESCYGKDQKCRESITTCCNRVFVALLSLLLFLHRLFQTP